MANALPDFEGGAFFKGRPLNLANEAIHRLNQLANATGGNGAHVSFTHSGMVFEAPPGISIEPPWYGVVVKYGPRGLKLDGAYTDARYWVQRLLPTESGQTKTNIYDFAKLKQPKPQDPKNPNAADNPPYEDAIVTAYNVAEHYATTDVTSAVKETHYLATGQIVEVRPQIWLPKTGGNAYQIYTFFVAPPLALFKVTGNATRPGCYTASSWTTPAQPFDMTVSTAPALADLGSVGSDSCYLINLREVGKSGVDLSQHDLDFTGTYAPLIFVGRYAGTATDNKNVYFIDGRQSQDCGT